MLCRTLRVAVGVVSTVAAIVRLWPTWRVQEVDDAMNIRRQVLEAFEGAALVSDPEEKARRTAFVVVGAGPTGLEFAAELNDCIQEDFSKLYPTEVEASSVTLVSSSKSLLSSYDKRVSEFTGALLGESECVPVPRRPCPPPACACTHARLRNGRNGKRRHVPTRPSPRAPPRLTLCLAMGVLLAASSCRRARAWWR
jgi:hypothetical protein